ncbi:MAG: FAD-dependent monooxygenase [Reyranellaceae bacterium]
MSRARPDLLPPTAVEIAIVGAGPAGCATALALAAKGVTDIALFEAVPDRAFRIGESVPAAALGLLERLGVRTRIAALQPLVSSGATSLWRRDVPGHNDGLLEPRGAGWHLDRAAFDGALRQEVRARDLRLFQGWRLQDVRRAAGGGFELAFDVDGRRATTTAAILVDATGVAARALRRLGIARNPVDALQIRYAVLELAGSGSDISRTWLEPAPYGWWYAARIPGDRLVAMLATDRDSLAASGLDLRRHEGFRAALAATRLIGRGPAAGAGAVLRLDSCSAPTAILSGVAGPGWLAVGDAAWSCDPLTAQGITKALDDGIAAAEAVARRRRGDADALGSYQAQSFARFTATLRLRAALYASQGRWPAAPFWRRRRGETDHSPLSSRAA